VHEEYGQQRLLEAVRARYKLPTDRLLDELLEDVHRFSSARVFEDDVCLVAVEIAKLGA
jgi:serine phosphatase RsbU (regulator of sigma subunit)